MPLVSCAWSALSSQTPPILSQMGVSAILKARNSLSLLGEQPFHGPVNLHNFQGPSLRHFSPGLQAISPAEELFLPKALRSDGPSASNLLATQGIRLETTAPQAVQFTVAVEKCQIFWRLPSPLWHSGFEGKQLEIIDKLRELLTVRTDKALLPDEELVGILDEHAHIEAWPYGHSKMNTWWGLRKLVCDRWTPADIEAKHAEHRKMAGMCLFCMQRSSKFCCKNACGSCCKSRLGLCHIHQSHSSWIFSVKRRRYRKRRLLTIRSAFRSHV